MEKAIKKVGEWLIFLAIVNLFILSMSIGQAAVEGRSGQWNSWWSWQANTVISLFE